MPLAQIGLFAATAIFLGVVGGTAGWLALTDPGGNAMPAASDHATAEHADGEHVESDPAGNDRAETGDDSSGHSDSGQKEAGHNDPGHADTGHGTDKGDHSSTAGHEEDAAHGADSAHASAHEQPAQEKPTPRHESPSTDSHADHAARTDGHAPATADQGTAPNKDEAAEHGPDTTHAPAPTDNQESPTATEPPRVAMAPAAVPNVGPAPKAPPVVVSPNSIPLTPAPDPAITSEGRYGPLPIRSAEGKLPWQVYARPFDAPTGTPRIAIVVTNMGLAEQPTLAAIQDLPGEITLAFSPYSNRLAEWVPAARAAGHEVLLQLPMEPRSTEFNDPGNKALLTANSPELNLDRMEWVLSRAEGYVGLTNLMGSRFTVSPKDMQPVLVAMDQRGLLYIDSRESPASIAGKLAVEIGLPAATNDRFIDAEAARGPIDTRLAQLEQLALARGSAVGFAADYPVAIERLRFWIEGLSARGFVLAPVSAVVRTANPE